MRVDDAVTAQPAVAAALEEHSGRIGGMESRRASFEDVFVALVSDA